MTSTQTATTSSTIIFIDSNLPDLDTLIASLPAGTETVLLQSGSDGFAQMADYLLGRTGLDSVQLISHGSSGAVTAGSSTLTADTIASHSAQLETIGAALKDSGDFLIYGCNVAQGTAGEALVQQIASITQTDVAASDDLTGAAAKGGDWVLEYQAGTVETPVNLGDTSGFSGVLVNQTINLGGAITSGSLASGEFTIDGLIHFKVTSASGFTVTQDTTNGWLCFEETSANGDFQVVITDTGADSQFKFVSVVANNQSTGGAPGYGAQLSLGIANSSSSATSSIIDGTQTIDLASYLAACDAVTVMDLELNISGTIYAEKTKISLQNLIVDLSASIPSVTSITRSSPAVSTTNADSLTWRITFSEAVQNVDAADFVVSGTTATVTGVTAVSASVYNVTVSGGDLANLEGSVSLTLAAGHNIVSTSASVALSSTTPSSTNDNFYSVSNNTIPTLAVTAANPTYTENGSAVDLFSGVTAATNDLAQTFTDMTLTVTNVSNGSSEVLNIGGTAVALNNGNSGTITGIGSYSVSVSGGTATVVLSGMTRSDAQMGTLIDGITYSNLSDNPGSSNRVVTITGITDSGTSNNSATPDLAATVSVSAVNDAPSIAGLQTDATVIEDTASNVDLSAVTLTDVDSGSNSITLTIAAAAGTLAATSGGSVTVGGSGSGTLTLTGTVANIDTYLNTASNIKYTGASNAHGDNATTLTLTANDGGNSGSGGGGNVSLGTVNVDITAVNDAPVIANLNGDASSVETGSGIVAIDAGGDMTIADIDSADFNGGSLTITQSGGTANGNFSVNGTTITSGSDGVIAAGETIAVGSTAIGTVHATNDGQVGHSLQIDFNTDATPALIQTLIHGLEYAAPSGLGVRAFTLTLNDGDGTANGGDADAAANFTIDITGTPQITSATYDAVTGTLVVTGVDINAKAGAANDIDASAFTLTGEGGATYTLTNTYDVERTSETQFTLTLSAADHAAVNQILNKDGTISTGGTTFNLAAADDWNTQVTDGDTSDATNGVMVSNVVTPTITGATYDSDTGVLVVNGNGFLKLNGVANDIDVSKLTFTGEGGDYTLSDSLADVEITSATSFSVTLTGTDKAQVDAKLDQIGASSTGGTTYNLAAAEDWAAGADAAIVVADTTGNGITVAIAPKITSATYNATTGVLAVTGTNIHADAGMDIDASQFTLTGEGGATYTLTNTADMERTSVTEFSLTLSATDQAAVNQMLNKAGTISTGGTTFNLAAADDWNTNVTDGNTADATNAVTVSNVPAPTITSAAYDAATNALVVTGANFVSASGANNDIVANKLTFTGEGGATYTLTDTANVDITSGTSFTLSLSATDQAAVEQILNKAGTSSTGATTYNLAAAEDWAAGADAAVVVADTNGNGITVSNVPLPTITSATYSAGTNTLVVTGTGFVSHSGAANDIDVSKLTFTGHGGAVYTLTDSADVEITSGTSFSVTLSAADQVAVENLMDKAGTSSIDGTTYNLAAAEDWAAGADAALNVADLTGNGIAATLNASPVVTSNGGGATAAIDVAENTVAVTTVTTTDADGDSITYSLTGGADQAKFTIDASTGALVFVAAPDYEHPTDADANNSYLVDVTASDGHGGTSVQTITVSVTNVDEYVAPPDDDDGVSTEVETQVPGLDTGSGSAVAGDGNGDGIADSQQADVTSTTFADETQGTQTYVTLVAGSDAGTPATGNASITHIEQLPVPADVPAEASLPLGLVSFTAEIGTATSETFSLFVSDQYVVNGYWKQAADGHWANIASAIEHVGHSWRIDFTITDGGEFDADGTVNGVIVDPGAVGYLPRESANTSELVAGLYAAFYDRAPGAAGLAYWVDELNSGSATLIDIARSFSEHPRFAQEYGGLDNAALAAKFYTNVLGQSGGAGGIAYWTAQLDAGTPVYQVMAAFIDCALNLDLGAMLEAGQLSQSDYTIACQRQTLLDNRVKAGLDFANLFGTSTVPTADATHLSGDAAYNAAIHVLDLVTADPESAYALAEQMATLVGTTDPMEAVLALA